MENKVVYTAVMLDEKSKDILKKEFKDIVPDGWEWIGHHMTITLGEIKDKSELGKNVTLKVISFGQNDKVMAIGVSGYESKNKIPHITLAINRTEGGKPVMCNYIEYWKRYGLNTHLTGVVSEYPIKPTQTLNEVYDVKSLPFYQDVITKNGKIYQVGGAVRDLYLGKESKDLDIVITGIPSNELEAILKKYGKVDMVGASFGVIKFTPPGGDEIDIAIPRTEKKTGIGYQGFDVSADHNLPIEKDLERRDFTINSIAKDSEGTIIDPFGGVKDLNAKLIKLTNPQAFADDPLRMLRAIQFASRFDFKIDEETFQAIQRNAMTISEISKERILIEFDKIVKKGNPRVGAELLVSSGLYKGIFGTEFDGEFEHFDYITRNSEFIYWLVESFTEQPDQYYKNIMKGDIDTAKEISALSYMYNNLPGSDKAKQRWVYFTVNKISPTILNSNYVRSILNDVINDFDTQKYPVNLSQLKLSGDDLINMGLKGKSIGDMLNKLMNAVFSDKVSNNKNNLLTFVVKNKDMINESTEMKQEKKVVFYDFDSTLMDSPLPETGKIIYKEKTGQVYPHQGWWGRPESLDLSIFDIQTNPEIEAKFRVDSSDPNTYVVLLTNRLSRLSEPIKKILNKHNIVFDTYSFKNDAREKGERVLDMMKSIYPNIKKLEFYDDDIKHIQNVRDNLIDTEYEFKVNHVIDGKV
jgi:tRNA nucleotidyltransferase/poly(A) polymerase